MAGTLYIREEPKPDRIVRGFLLDCRFNVTKITTNPNEGISFLYENSEGNYDSYILENASKLTIVNGMLHWTIDLGHKIQNFYLRLNHHKDQDNGNQN